MSASACTHAQKDGAFDLGPQQYEGFTRTLHERLAADARVIGLIALGSMADVTRRDQWSDHDFWVITNPSHAEAFLSDLSWLPNADDIVLAFRQGHSYYTVLYRSGHSIEFAVFDPEQMQRGKTNRYAVLFDKADIASALQQIREQTITSTRREQAEISDTTLLNYFFIQLLTGVQRYYRGEFLSSQQTIYSSAVNNLLFLIHRYIPAEEATMIDTFDQRRYFERVYPTIAQQIHAALKQEIPATALGLLLIADEYLAPPHPGLSI